MHVASNDAAIDTHFSGAYVSSTKNANTNTDIGAGNQNDSIWNIKFNALYSNSIYGKSLTVQPPTLQMIAQIKY